MRDLFYFHNTIVNISAICYFLFLWLHHRIIDIFTSVYNFHIIWSNESYHKHKEILSFFIYFEFQGIQHKILSIEQNMWKVFNYPLGLLSFDIFLSTLYWKIKRGKYDLLRIFVEQPCHKWTSYQKYKRSWKVA